MTESVARSHPTSAAAVANVFLNLQDRDVSNFPKIDHMKLQKLVYYSHSWWLAHKNEPLFEDDIEAWPWGPVIRNLYTQFQKFGRSAIADHRAKELVSVGPNPLDYKLNVPNEPNDEVVGFLESIWSTHKHLSGIQLSNATHMGGEPWKVTLDHYGDLGLKPRIPNELIRDVFKQKLKAS